MEEIVSIEDPYYILAGSSLHHVTTRLALSVEAGFTDIFDNRGPPRKTRVRLGETEITGDASVVTSNEGLDGVLRRTRLEFEPTPETISPKHARFRTHLEP